MTALSPLGKLPIPELTDRLDGPTAFSSFAKRAEDISVIPYATAAARSAAYSGIAPTRSPTAGTLTYLIDTSSFEFWNGAQWVPIHSLDLPLGIVAQSYSTAPFPADGSYVPQNTERMHTALLLTVSLTAARWYEISFECSLVDGGPGSSPTSKCVRGHVRYNNSATPPTAASGWVVWHQAQVLSDDSGTAGGLHMTGRYSPPTSGTYTFNFSMMVYCPGARLSGMQQLSITDIGRI